MTRVLVDTSVLIKWFHDEGESELAEARALRRAHLEGDVDAHLLDLGVYEVGNVLVRALRWDHEDVTAQLDDLLTILGPALTMAPAWLAEASRLASVHNLGFYDASWAAAASALDIPLVSADRHLLASGLASSVTDIVRRLHLPA